MQFLTKAPAAAHEQEGGPRWRIGKNHSWKQSVAAAPVNPFHSIFTNAGKIIIDNSNIYPLKKLGFYHVAIGAPSHQPACLHC